MSNNKKNTVNQIRETQRSYLNRDFNSFRANLTSYARTFFSDKITDFGQTGMAGMLIELSAYVGDVMSYYIDHQFQELDISEAVEPANVERLITGAGVKISGASPSTVEVDFYLEIPAVKRDNEFIPDKDLMPIIKIGTVLSSGGGVNFTLTEDIDMGEKKKSGEFYADYNTMKSDSDGNPTSFAVKRSGLCVSSTEYSETFSIPNKFKPFRTITLSKSHISEIISITDTEGNEYYEVDSLSQDTVFKRIINISDDSDLVPENLELIPAPRRFISNSSNITKKTTVRFGGGLAESTDNDTMPDPSELSLPLYGKRKTLSNFTIDPNRLLKTSTLGIAPQNTTLTVLYRAGGGISHNVNANSIKNVKTLKTKFKNSVTSGNISSIRSSIEVNNDQAASGGEAAPTLDELRGIALSYKNSQARIVTKQDLIARIYTMPNKFGRVFRVGIRSNPNNPLSSVISIISRDSSGNLIVSPDSLKENLRIYLNESRLISDALDIVDTQVVNIGVSYGVTVSGFANTDSVIQNVNTSLKEYFKIENFQIEQPIMISDIVNIIINTKDVVSLVSLDFLNLTGESEGNEYSDISFSVNSNTERGMIICPPGSIFEIKYPDDDIVGSSR
jgi:hypothetical protein